MVWPRSLSSMFEELCHFPLNIKSRCYRKYLCFTFVLWGDGNCRVFRCVEQSRRNFGPLFGKVPYLPVCFSVQELFIFLFATCLLSFFFSTKA